MRGQLDQFHLTVGRNAIEIAHTIAAPQVALRIFIQTTDHPFVVPVHLFQLRHALAHYNLTDDIARSIYSTVACLDQITGGSRQRRTIFKTGHFGEVVGISVIELHAQVTAHQEVTLSILMHEADEVVRQRVGIILFVEVAGHLGAIETVQSVLGRNPQEAVAVLEDIVHQIAGEVGIREQEILGPGHQRGAKHTP